MQIVNMRYLCVAGAKSSFLLQSEHSSTSSILKPGRSEQQTFKHIFHLSSEEKWKNAVIEERCDCSGDSRNAHENSISDLSTKTCHLFWADQFVLISSQKTQRRNCLYWTITSSDTLWRCWEKLKTLPSPSWVRNRDFISSLKPNEWIMFGSI